MAPISCESLTLGAPGLGERPFLVRVTDAIRLCRDDSYQPVPFRRAAEWIDRLGPWDMAAARDFVARAKLSPFGLQRLDDARLRALLRGQLRSGDLVVIDAGEGGTAGEDDSQAKQRRLVQEIEAKSQRRLGYAGRQYRLVVGSRFGGFPDRDRYEVVSHREAVGVLRALAGQSNGDLTRLLNEAASMLTNDWRPPFQPDGLVLLRRTIVYSVPKPDVGSALTPSQMKKLAKSDWIEIELVDQDGEPRSMGYQLELADQSIREGRFDKDGFLGVYEIESGNCNLTLKETIQLSGADEAEPEEEPEPQPTEAEAPEPEVQVPEPSVPEVQLPAVEPPLSEFRVKVVDEAGSPIAAVPMVFRWIGGEESAPTGSDGVAKSMAAAAFVNVSFESPESLSEIVSAVWAARTSAASEDYLASSDQVIAVTSRPAAIELADGCENFNPVPLEPGKSKTLSVRPAKKRAVYVQLHDTLFRNDSAVVNPEGEAPATRVGEHHSITSVGLIATILRYNQEHDGRALFIAAHTDRAGSESDNVSLSSQRGKAVLALIEGDKGAFVEACTAKNSEVDVTQLMDWTNKQYGFTCKPSVMDRAPSDENYYRFRTSYNEWVKGPLEPDENGPRGAAIGGTGRVRPDIWEAMFDLYEHNLRQELDEDSNGVAGLRKVINWVDSNKKYVGYGERHPTVPGTADGTRRDVDRRVEVIFFDKREAPNVSVTNGDEIYDGATYVTEVLPAMASASRKDGFWFGIPRTGPLAWSTAAVFTIESEDRRTQRDYGAADAAELSDYFMFWFPSPAANVQYVGYIVDAAIRYDLFGPSPLRQIADPRSPVNHLASPAPRPPPADVPPPAIPASPAPTASTMPLEQDEESGLFELGPAIGFVVDQAGGQTT